MPGTADDRTVGSSARSIARSSGSSPRGRRTGESISHRTSISSSSSYSGSSGSGSSGSTSSEESGGSSESDEDDVSGFESKEMASEKSVSMKSVTEATSGSMEAGEDEPLLGSKGMGSTKLSLMGSLAESTFIMSGGVVSGLTGTPVLSDGVAVESPKLRVIRFMTRCICCFFCLALLVGIFYMIWQRLERLKHWINAFFPASCIFTEWADWSACSRTCGLGRSGATRATQPIKCKPQPPPSDLVRTRFCELAECPGRPCVVGPWHDWGGCSERCGEGIQLRVRTVLQAANAGGVLCPTLVQTARCDSATGPCSPLCRLTPWTGWSACSRTCGRGRTSRSRTLVDAATTGVPCPRLVEDAECLLAACEPACTFDVPPMIPRALGLERCNGTASGAVCDFACEAGYVRDKGLVCVDGIFVRSHCSPIICKNAPQVNNSVGLWACRGYPSGSKCRVVCRPGFTKSGDSVCRDGNWTEASCQENSCGAAPFIEYSTPVSKDSPKDVSALCSGLLPGQNCTQFACIDGFVKSEELTCVGGNFNRPRCVEAPCQHHPPRVRHSDRDTDHCMHLVPLGSLVPSRSHCPVTCLEGFRKTRDSLCVRGVWYPGECLFTNDTCWESSEGCGKGCQTATAPQVGNATWPPDCGSNSVVDGAACEVRCKKRYEPTGNLLCIGGMWFDVSCQRRRCLKRPGLKHGHGLLPCAGAAHGDECALSCEANYRPSRPHLRCEHGEWRGAECLELRCPAPPVPWRASGNYDLCAGLRPGEWCPVHCEEGHDPLPKRGLECLRGGHFAKAVCVPRRCENSPRVAHSGDLTACAGQIDSSVCAVSCVRSRFRAGSLWCDHGNWTVAACLPSTDCGAVPMIPHSVTPLSDCIDMRPGGQPCSAFGCLPGFEQRGSLSCGEDGHFSRPSCEPASCARAPSIAHMLPGTDAKCAGIPSGEACRLECQAGFAKTADPICRQGVFSRAWCEPLVGREQRARESLSVEIRLGVSYEALLRHLHGVAPGPRLIRAIGMAAGIDPRRVLNRGARPGIPGTSVIAFDLLASTTTESSVPSSGNERDGGSVSGSIPGRDAVKVGEDVEALTPARDAVSHLAEALTSLGQLTQLALESLLPDTGDAQALVVASTIGKTCREVPHVTHAAELASCIYTLSGGECPLVCKEGHTKTGNLICSDGVWNDAKCAPIACTHAPEVEHAEDLSHCRGTATGSLCDLECRPGYTKNGDLECREGHWLLSTCLPKGCDFAPMVRHGNPPAHTQCQGMSSGQECTLRCAAGMLPIDFGVLRCELGNWRRLGECKPAACYHVPKVLHAATDLAGCSGTKHGDECPFVCEDGFVRSSDAMRCLFGRFIASAGRCEASVCDAIPDVPGLGFNELSGCAPASHGTPCHVNCGFGRRLSAPLVCDHGSWTKAACVDLDGGPLARPCPRPPVVPLAASVDRCVDAEHGQACDVDCDRGHRPDSRAYCADGLWTPSVSCEPISCDEAPSVEHAAHLEVCAGLGHGSKCLFWCMPGYSPGGQRILAAPQKVAGWNMSEILLASSLTCRLGRWEGPDCLEAACDSPPPGIRHARSLSHCAGTRSRHSCHIECSPGYYAMGFPECVRGAWSIPDFARCEEAPCLEAPRIPNALPDLADCANRKSGETCPLVCESGYVPTGDVFCLRGDWLDAACVEHCREPPLGVSDATDISHCAGTPVGGSCELVCGLGYRPSGPLHCREGPRWDSAFCYDVAAALPKAAVMRARIAGLRVGTGGEIGQAAESFRITVAGLLRVVPDLVSVELQLRDGGSTGGGETSLVYDLELRALCQDPQCPELARRCDEALGGADLAQRLRDGFCERACPASGGHGGACLTRCRLRQQLKFVSKGKATVFDADSSIDNDGTHSQPGTMEDQTPVET